jgi:hypothetical protein
MIITVMQDIDTFIRQVWEEVKDEENPRLELRVELQDHISDALNTDMADMEALMQLLSDEDAEWLTEKAYNLRRNIIDALVSTVRPNIDRIISEG